jgi:hypothetical protein
LPFIDPAWLTCQSLGVPILNNSRHERFAQLVANGKHSDMEAFGWWAILKREKEMLLG